MHNKHVAGFTVATSSLPVKLYPWDCSEFTVSPSHGDACRCVKPNQEEEKKEEPFSGTSQGTEKHPSVVVGGRIRWLWGSGYFLFVFFKSMT